jgi:hypothetical protein
MRRKLPRMSGTARERKWHDIFSQARGPLGLQRLPVIRRDRYADAVAVETVGRYIEYHGTGWRAGKDYPAIPGNSCRISGIG